MSELQEKQEIERRYPNRRYAWYVTFVLLVTSVVSFVDRQILALLIEPVKLDLSLSDTQISVLHGLAFAIFYAVMGVPLGRLVDAKNRRTIIAVGLTCWSAMTMACGLAKNFGGIFLARIGVGVGEATFTPAAYSMVSDYFPKDSRSKPISLIAMGPYVGGGISFLAGGYIISMIPQGTELVLPVIGAAKPWQLVFMVVGFPGLILAALIQMTIKEPLRRDTIAAQSNVQLPLIDTINFIRKHISVYALLTLGYSSTAMAGYSIQAWTPSLFIRNFGWTTTEIGYAAGLVIMIAGGGGTFLGGIIADRQVKKGRSDAYLRVSAWFSFAPFIMVLAALSNNAWLALALLAPTFLCLGIHIGVGMAAITQITPNEFRGQVVAVYLFVLVILGAGIGPVAVAFFTDYVFKDPYLIHYSLALFSVIVGTAASLLFWSGLKPYRTMMESRAH